MSEHVTSRGLYIAVWAALLALTGITVAVAQVSLGPLNDVVALAVAVGKALLVLTFFMGLKDSGRLLRLTVIAGFFWLAILISITLADYLSRPSTDALRGVPPASAMARPERR
ncbi:MAG TPA: cytochrome C oxidase subunit IV family protein [Thermoanaerobaculia bacterium]|nr:cytochrome C oxidase subunit IV family protein [Thermoanaerobaculia bacterium]